MTFEEWWRVIVKQDNPIPPLTGFLAEIIEAQDKKRLYPVVGRLYKNFGMEIVFWGIESLGRYDTSRLKGDIYPLLYSICSNILAKRIEEQKPLAAQPLDDYIREVTKGIEEARKRLAGEKVEEPTDKKHTRRKHNDKPS
jgi:hypothetical protein